MKFNMYILFRTADCIDFEIERSHFGVLLLLTHSYPIIINIQKIYYII